MALRELDKLLLTRFLVIETLGTLFLTLLEYSFGGISFFGAFRHMCFIASQICMAAIGKELFWNLDQNRWKLRWAYEDYPIGSAVFLIIVNAAIGLLVMPDYNFVIPNCIAIFILHSIVWAVVIICSMINRWAR